MNKKMEEKTYRVESDLLKETIFVKIIREHNSISLKKGMGEIEEVKQIAVSHIKDKLKITEISIEEENK